LAKYATLEQMKDEYPMRINRYLALKNYSTRRGADKLIEGGRVYINGRRAVLGDKVDKDDQVEVKIKKGEQKEYQYFAYYKPAGLVTLATTKGEKDITSTVELKDVFPVGRLDKASHGLIILTSDGRVTDRLLNPKHEHEKEYVVSTVQKLRSSFKEKMEAGVEIDDYTTKPSKVKILDDNKFSIVLYEGKHHQIRRMCSALFAEVKDLKRTRIMNIKLGSLNPGQYRKLEGEELKKFLENLGLA
jgi:23S rRNA pseudouridine2604 synthase